MRRERPSTTARKAALNLLALGSNPGTAAVLPSGVVEATAQVLLASGVVGERAVRFARTRCAVSIYRAFDWMMPGQFEAFAHRKAFCERHVRQGIDDGASQVLALGAGYDTLGLRLGPEFPEVRFFEIDHPATAGRKATGIAKLGQPANLHLVAEDLGEHALADVLSALGEWDARATSVVVAEGLLQYLRPEATRELFLHCSAVTGPGSRVAFTYIGSGIDGRPDVGRWTGLVLWILRATGEPWLSSIRPTELPRFLAETGWIQTPEQMAASTKHGVEHMAVAEKRSNGG